VIRRLWTQLTGGCPQCEDRERVRASRQQKVDEALANAKPDQLSPAVQHQIDEVQTAVAGDFANNGVDLADPEDAFVALVTIHVVETSGQITGQSGGSQAAGHSQAIRGLFEAARSRHDSRLEGHL
jgi:uncharacterized Zn finger protein (UPF0148 family)